MPPRKATVLKTVSRGDAEEWARYEETIAMQHEAAATGQSVEALLNGAIGAVGGDEGGLARASGARVFRDDEQPQGFTRVFRLTGANRGQSFLYPTLWLGALLQQRHPDSDPRDPDGGKLAYTIQANRAPAPVQGSQKCFLHPESPDIATVRELGIATVCYKSNLPGGKMGVEAHATSKHGGEWRMYQAHIKETREQERLEGDAIFREAVVASMRGGAS